MNRLEPVRDLIVLLLKEDLAILAGFGTLLTVLDLGGGELLEAAGRLALPVAGICVVGLIGLICLMDLVGEMTESPTERSIFRGKILMLGVVGLHVVGYGFAGSEVFLFVKGEEVRYEEQVFRQQNDGVRARVDSAVTAWVKENGKVPSRNDLDRYPEGRELLRWLRSSDSPPDFKYERVDSLEYSYTLPGPDNRVGVGDDQVRIVTYEVVSGD